MKRIIWVFIIVCCADIIPANSQILQGGIKGGINLSEISFSGSESNLRPDNRTGFFIGPSAEITVPLIGLGLEVSALYNQDKLKCDYASTNLKTLEVPVNFKWSVGIRKIACFYFAAGPQFGFNLGREWESDYLIKKQRISCNIGTGIKLFNHVQLGVNYNFAFNRSATLFMNRGTEQEHRIRVTNNAWQASLSFYM